MQQIARTTKTYTPQHILVKALARHKGRKLVARLTKAQLRAIVVEVLESTPMPLDPTPQLVAAIMEAIAERLTMATDGEDLTNP